MAIKTRCHVKQQEGVKNQAHKKEDKDLRWELDMNKVVLEPLEDSSYELSFSKGWQKKPKH